MTNGVHTPTWDSALADELWTEACGKDRWLGTETTIQDDIRQVSDARLWRFRTESRQTIVQYARERLARQLAGSGASLEDVEQARQLFDPHTLTLGFARRFASYKRPNLLLHDPERLLRLLNNPERPVQLILAGKAHPADQAGRALIQEWTRTVRRPENRSHAIFLGDYDMHLTEHMVQGVDVWLNTPRRPWEACGTSGMKVLVNGGLNLSELDGWWAEAYTPEVGWALGDGREHNGDPAWDALEANALYDLLEHHVIPEFYTRDDHGIPTAWVQRIRESMAQLTPQFSANRAVREYTEEHYLPAARRYHARSANRGAFGRELLDWQHSLELNWNSLHFGEVKVETHDGQHLFEVQVYLNGLDPQGWRVELYANPIDNQGTVRLDMPCVRKLTGDAAGTYVYSTAVSAIRPPADYTPRLIPYHPGVSIPLENSRILWQR